MGETALRVCPSAGGPRTKSGSGTARRWPAALKGASSMRVRPHPEQTHLCRPASTFARSMPCGRRQGAIAPAPWRTNSAPQCRHSMGAASAATSLPGTAGTTISAGRGFPNVPKSTDS